MIINKHDFVEIINRMQDYEELQGKIQDLFDESLENIENDFCNAGSICIGHGSIVIKLLENMFETDLISWWIYEREYGKYFKIGDLIDNGEKIDLSNSEKLYDYLIKNLEKNQEHIK